MNNLLQTFFFSGSSSITDLRATLAGGGNPGVVGKELSEPASRLLTNQHTVFMDSGAFGKGSNPDFQKVFYSYDWLLGCVGAHNSYIVMPDDYRNQEGSLALLEEHKATVRGYIELGCEAIVPLQRGSLSLREVYDRTVEILGTDCFRVGLPMAHEARHSKEAIHAFLLNKRPNKVHFLGRSFYPLRKELEFYKAFTEFDASADAAMVVNWTSSGKACGDNYRERHYQVASLENPQVTGGDDLHDVYCRAGSLSEDEISMVAKTFRLSPDAVRDVIKLDEVDGEAWEEFINFHTWNLSHCTDLDAAILKLYYPKSDFRFEELKKKVETYLSGSLYDRIDQGVQPELLLCA